MEVFTASLAHTIKKFSAARLTAKAKRARTLRDKFRDLLQRQKIATRRRTGTKAGTGSSANERTEKKAEIFDEVLQRFSAPGALRQAPEPAPPPAPRAGRNDFRCGEKVAFEDKHLNTVVGVVVRINKRTASIDPGDGTTWRVGFSLLRHLIDI